MREICSNEGGLTPLAKLRGQFLADDRPRAEYTGLRAGPLNSALAPPNDRDNPPTALFTPVDVRLMIIACPASSGPLRPGYGPTRIRVCNTGTTMPRTSAARCQRRYTRKWQQAPNGYETGSQSHLHGDRAPKLCYTSCNRSTAIACTYHWLWHYSAQEGEALAL
jgi:hypothetical protein